MKQYRSGGSLAAVAGTAMLLALGATPAQAQGPGGSYLETCTHVRGFGDRLVADCRRVDGSWGRTALDDVGSCRGDIANMNGHLTCGRGGPAYGWNRRHEWQGYGSSDGPRYYDYRYGYGR